MPSLYAEIPQVPRLKSRFDIDDDDDRDIIDHLSADEGQPEKTVRAPKASTLFLDPDAFRRLSPSPSSDFGELGGIFMAPPPRPFTPPPGGRMRQKPTQQSAWRFWNRNKSVLLVFFAQLFGALMNLAARLLELEGEGMHPLQLLFARMSLTTAASCVYMYWKKVPHFPFGAREVRWLLVVRGVSGFFGIFGMWFSLMYLSMAEAVVISFLVPSFAGYICHILLHDPFTRKEQISSFIALAGVVLIARPVSLFSSTKPPTTSPEPGLDIASNTTAYHQPHLGDDVPPSQRLMAIGVALVGVLGGSGAFTTIRAIGTRAHPLISVNYFSTWCTIVSTTVLSLAPVLNVGQPELQFGFPHSLRQWALLLFICVCGFCTQFLMTAGLGGERSNRATAMVYTHMLFAVGFDKWVFGTEMSVVSLFGCGLIIGSALWVVLSKRPSTDRPADIEEVPRLQVVNGEATAMLNEELSSDSEDGLDGIPLRAV